MVAENNLKIRLSSVLYEAKKFSATSLYERLDVTGRFPCRCKFLAAAFEFCHVFYFIDDPNTIIIALDIIHPVIALFQTKQRHQYRCSKDRYNIDSDISM
jgi:hypothetical protein